MISVTPLHRPLAVFLALIISFFATAASRAEPLTVAYFQEWPTPSQFAQHQKLYDKALGIDIKWVAFDSGTAMSAAMASGDVQISFSQGIPPFVVATSAGQDIQIVDIAVSYAENDNCVVRSSLEIDRDNVKELAGKQVALPIGTTAHYGFLKQMQHFGVDISSMKKHGHVLMSGAEKEALGIRVFDATTVSTQWAQENAELLEKFLKVTAQMNTKFAHKGADEMLPVIATTAGMDVEATRDTMKGFSFLDTKQQLSKKWLGGGTQKFIKEVADFFVSQGIIPKARKNYNDAVDSSYLEAAAKL